MEYEEGYEEGYDKGRDAFFDDDWFELMWRMVSNTCTDQDLKTLYSLKETCVHYGNKDFEKVIDRMIATIQENEKNTKMDITEKEKI